VQELERFEKRHPLKVFVILLFVAIIVVIVGYFLGFFKGV
jgi:hypothetical protein